MATLTVEQLLASSCPHGKELGQCQEVWCASRVEDLLHGEYAARLPDPDDGAP